ncbi:MAG: hypothetical protein J0I41_13385 [Filimonas sp.]|nr:hypothetical protein [Filimonas sp.]
MDACFDIILPFSVDLSTLGFEIPVFGGDQELSLKKEGRRKFGNNFDLRVFDAGEEMIKFRKRFLPEDFLNRKWITIGVVNLKGFDEFYFSGKGLGNLSDPNSPTSMLNTILKNAPMWVVVLSDQCDSFDYVANGDISDVEQEIINYYTGDNRGFLIYH